MNKTQFTPGPWKWWTSNSWRRLKRDDVHITQSVMEPFVCRDGHPDCSISKADMALIASAPDLYEAVKTALELACEIDDYHEGRRATVPIIDARRIAFTGALAKARGETK